MNDIKNKLVLLRVDINSALDREGIVLDQPRFIEASQTIKDLTSRGSRLVIIAHQGRKGGEDFCPLEQHARILSKHTGIKIRYVDDLFGESANNAMKSLKEGQAIIMKNLREFDEETKPETQNNRFIEFSKKFDLFINDAFPVSHRKQSSIIIPPKFIKSEFGPHFLKEIQGLKQFSIDNNPKNTMIVLGGSKVEDYIPLFKFLKERSNKVIAGGVIGNLLLKIRGEALGYEEGWLREKGYDKLINDLKKIFNDHRTQIILPVDFALSGEKREETDLSRAPFNKKIMDVGRKSVELFEEELSRAKKVIMKGPLGFAEISQFSYSTDEVLKFLSKLHKERRIPVLIGGGHLTTTAFSSKNLQFSHISLAGGASITYLTEGIQGLPGMIAINNNL